MKPPFLLLMLVVITAACSKNESASPSKTGVDKTQEIIKQETAATMTAEAELKKQASLVAQGIGDDENLLKSFNSYIQTTNALSYTQSNATNLRAELFTIFNGRINLYLNMLNASLEGKRSAISLNIDDNDPDSALNALTTLYNSLGTKRARTKLSLAEQYLIFDITIYLKKKFATQNQQTIPTQAIVRFLKEQISANINTPQDTFFAYQVANEILDSNDGLFTAFYPILSHVKINEFSSHNEVELFKRISFYALEKNFTDFIQSKEEVELYFSNITFIASNKIDKLQKLGFDQRLGYFETIDYAFKAFNAYLGKTASENSLTIQETADIQDHFVKTTYFDLLNSLNKNKDIYSRLFKESCLNFKSRELDLIIKSYSLTLGQEQDISCITLLKDKLTAKKMESIKILTLLKDEEILELNLIQREDLKNYFRLYNQYNLSNLILNIIAKNGSKEEISTLASMYETSKNDLNELLKLRDARSVVKINSILPEKSEQPVYIKAGIYSGNIDSDLTILLHPLALLVPDGKEFIIKVNSIFGGRIEGNFKFEVYDLVKNSVLNNSISRGSIPFESNITKNRTGWTNSKIECHGGGGGGGGSSGGGLYLISKPYGCIRLDPEPIYTVSRAVTHSVTPGQAYVGLKGNEAANIKIIFKERTIIETFVVSVGLQGYMGNKGINAPTCNSSNEYQVYRGRQYSFTCLEKDCQPQINNHEGNYTVFHSYAGPSGNGGTGGAGGNISIHNASDTSPYPALSLGGLGGKPGEQASCSQPGQGNLSGSVGSQGPAGIIEVTK